MYLNNDNEISSPTIQEWLYRIPDMYNHIYDIYQPISYKQSTYYVENASQFNIDD